MKRILLIIAISLFALMGLCTVCVVAIGTMTEPSSTPSNGGSATERVPTATPLPTSTPTPTATATPSPTPEPLFALTVGEFFEEREQNPVRFDVKYEDEKVLLSGVVCEIRDETLLLGNTDDQCRFLSDKARIRGLPTDQLIEPTVGDSLSVVCTFGEYSGTIFMEDCVVSSAETLSAYATVTPLPAPVLTNTPRPAPTLTPTPPPTATPRPAGLGINRQSVVEFFEDPSFGFTFEEAPLLDGTPRVLGTSQEGAIIELVGPPIELTGTTITVGITNDDYTNLFNSLAMLGLILQVTSWQGATEWLPDAMLTVTPERSVSTRYNRFDIRLEAFDIGQTRLLLLNITR